MSGSRENRQALPVYPAEISDDDSIEVQRWKAARAARIPRAATIEAAVTCARARLLELENRVAENQDQAEEEAELLERFDEAKTGALMIFDLGIEGLHHDATDVLEARQEVEAAAAELWNDIQDHNNGLLQQQPAAERARLRLKAAVKKQRRLKREYTELLTEQARLAELEADHEEQRLDRALAKLTRGTGEPPRAARAARLPGEMVQQQQLDRARAARLAEEEALREAQQAAERARLAAEEEARPEEAQWRAARAGGYPDAPSARAPRSRSGSYAASPYAGPLLYASTRSTSGSNGSMSLGNGYTVDRPGRWHDRSGRLVGSSSSSRSSSSSVDIDSLTYRTARCSIQGGDRRTTGAAAR